MRARSIDAMPPRLRRLLAEVGRDISVARRKRRLPMELVAERASMSMATYQRVEKGDPSVSLGGFVMVLLALGFADRFASLFDASRDDVGLLQDARRLPRRIVLKRERRAVKAEGV